MEDCLKDLAKYRFEKAEKNLTVAKQLYQDEIFGVALNRSYYAAFDAMRAVNALDKFDSSKHSGVIAHFNQMFVKTGVFPPDVSAIIRRASMLREKSDYEDFYEPDQEETEQAIEEVERFLSLIEGYLNSAIGYTRTRTEGAS